jgi:hypothetical protein
VVGAGGDGHGGGICLGRLSLRRSAAASDGEEGGGDEGDRRS